MKLLHESVKHKVYHNPWDSLWHRVFDDVEIDLWKSIYYSTEGEVIQRLKGLFSRLRLYADYQNVTDYIDAKLGYE